MNNNQFPNPNWQNNDQNHFPHQSYPGYNPQQQYPYGGHIIPEKKSGKGKIIALVMIPLVIIFCCCSGIVAASFIDLESISENLEESSEGKDTSEELGRDEFFSAEEVNEYISIIRSSQTVEELENDFNDYTLEILPRTYRIRLAITEQLVSQVAGSTSETLQVTPTDNLELHKTHLELLVNEISRYPISVVGKAVTNLTLVESISYGNENVKHKTAGLTTGFDRVFLAYNSTTYSQEELDAYVDIFNHEVWHAVMNNIKINNIFDDEVDEQPDIKNRDFIEDKWAQLNANDKESYGEVDDYFVYVPQPGFITGYAMTAIEEDQAEVFRCLMEKQGGECDIRTRAKTDRVLQNKIDMIYDILDANFRIDPDADLFSRPAA